MMSLWNATHTMVDVSHDIDDLIGAVGPFEHTCRCPLFPAKWLEFARPERGRLLCLLLLKFGRRDRRQIGTRR